MEPSGAEKGLNWTSLAVRAVTDDNVWHVSPNRSRSSYRHRLRPAVEAPAPVLLPRRAPRLVHPRPDRLAASRCRRT